MQFTLKQLSLMIGSLNVILEKDLKPKIAYRLSKFAKKVSRELELAEEVRKKSIVKYAKKTEGTEDVMTEGEPGKETVVFESEEVKKAYFDAFNELYDSKVTIEFIPINIDQLGDAIPGVILFTLDELFTDEEVK